MNTVALQQPRTEQGTITVARIVPPNGNRRSHTVQDTEGVMFGVWPDKISLFREGESYEISFTVNDKGFRDIKKAQMIERPATAPAQPARAATSPSGNRAGEYYRPTAPRDSERMFVCSTLNAFIQTGRIDCDRAHLKAAILELRAAYAETFGIDDR